MHSHYVFFAQVGIGCASAKEVATAIQKSVRDAKKNLVKINLTKDASFPHFAEHYEHSAKIMLRPAAEGTGEPCSLQLGIFRRPPSPCSWLRLSAQHHACLALTQCSHRTPGDVPAPCTA